MWSQKTLPGALHGSHALAVMGPRLPLLVAVLASCLLPAPGCVICDKRVEQALKALETEYLPKHLPQEQHKEFMERVRIAVNDFQVLPYEEKYYMGVIDEPTLDKAVLVFLKDLQTMRDSGMKVDELSLGPAPSGRMLQALIWCNTCMKDIHICRKKGCPDRDLSVHEMDDLILDCERSWHKLSQGLTNYRFFRVWENKTETLLSEGKEPVLTKHMVEQEDAGTYRCELGLVEASPATNMRFHVKVLPPKVNVEHPIDIELPDSEEGTVEGEQPAPPATPASVQTPSESTPPQTSQSPKPESMLRGRLVGLLIWGSVVLIAGIATAILYFHSGKVIESIKTSLFGGDSEDDKEPEDSEKKPELENK
ncbi:Izumo sperm-egg fusion protein 1 [Galemys pyrenaicus]|uniref:Izumo sperm-egg fusion protein 1 n=1 Tax=Galemys pyrenaicus TaxID=202257 RepID=A0A8J6AL29_GALPY|nr:Izumo sperm-egg fusion protein 1 [Galemys pyrenaicus]